MMGVGTMGAALSAFPTSPIMRSIHHRTIAIFAAQQRLLGISPLTMNVWELPMKKLMARIRITEEMMTELTGLYPYADAARKEIETLVHDMATHSWVKP